MMSEKRFAMAYGGNVIEDKVEKKAYQTSTFKEDVEKVVALLNQLWEENEQLRQRIAFFEKQADEFEQYTAQTIQNMIANYRDGE